MPHHKKFPWMTDEWSSPSMNLLIPLEEEVGVLSTVVICTAWVFVRKPVNINSCFYTKNLGRYRFFSGIIQGKFSLFKQPTQQQKVGNGIVFFAFLCQERWRQWQHVRKTVYKGEEEVAQPQQTNNNGLKSSPIWPEYTSPAQAPGMPLP